MTVSTSRRAFIIAGITSLALFHPKTRAKALTITSDVDAKTLDSSKTTPLGLYLTPKAAHQALLDNPDIIFVDVRDPIEITFVGHPEGLDKIIPLHLASHEVDPESGQYRMVDNPGFLDDFTRFLTSKSVMKDHPIFIICRSGNRSATAARLLIKAEYTNVWNLTEGFEGDKTPEGVRALNGWRNAGLPWSYKLAKGVAWGNQTVR